MNFEGAIQSLDRASLLSGCEFDFNQALITFHISRIQSDSAIGVIDRLVCSLQISRIDESELLIWFGVIRIRFDCIFQNVDCLRKIILLYQQTRNARSEAGFDASESSWRATDFAGCARGTFAGEALGACACATVAASEKLTAKRSFRQAQQTRYFFLSLTL